MASVSFIHMSDIHFLLHAEPGGLGALLCNELHPIRNVCGCLCAEKKDKPGFVLITGDLADNGGAEEYRALRRTLDEQLDGIPLVTLPGNHDDRTAYCSAFLGIEPREAVDSQCTVGGLRIVTLDTGRGMQGEISGRQHEWLRSILSEPAPMGTLLALHHSLVPGPGGFAATRYDPFFYELIAQSDVIGIFCGHTHQNCIGQFAQKPCITADSMAFTLKVNGDAALCENRTAYNLVEVCDGNLCVQIKQLTPSCDVAVSLSIDQLNF